MSEFFLYLVLYCFTLYIILGFGNAFSILARCQSAARRAAWDERYLEEFLDEATSSDYNHLLRTVATYFTVV
jgi:hypothetical protein